MFVDLVNKTVEIEVRHAIMAVETGDIFSWEEKSYLLPAYPDKLRRCTVVTLKDNTLLSYSMNNKVITESICKEGDNFCKAEGRKRAGNSLLRWLRNHCARNYSKMDRAYIFRAICPEYFKV